MGDQSRHHPPLRAGLCAGWSTPRDLPLDAVLLTQFGHTIFCEVTEGEAREDIYSSVNFFSSFLLL